MSTPGQRKWRSAWFAARDNGSQSFPVDSPRHSDRVGTAGVQNRVVNTVLRPILLCSKTFKRTSSRKLCEIRFGGTEYFAIPLTSKGLQFPYGKTPKLRQGYAVGDSRNELVDPSTQDPALSSFFAVMSAKLLAQELGFPDCHSKVVCVGSSSACSSRELARAAAVCNLDDRMIDSGSGRDLIDIDSIPRDQRQCINTLTRIGLCTAGGESWSMGTLPVEIASLDEITSATVMQSTPNVLSLGKRVLNQGYGFYWLPYSRPYLVLPDGTAYVLDVKDFIPYLSKDSPAVPVNFVRPETDVDLNYSPSFNRETQSLMPAVPSPGASSSRFTSPEDEVERRRLARISKGKADVGDKSGTAPPIDSGEAQGLAHNVSDPKESTTGDAEGVALESPIPEPSRGPPRRRRGLRPGGVLGKSRSSENGYVSSDDDTFALLRNRPDDFNIRDLKTEAKSIYHLMVHIPKNPWCDFCVQAKMQRRSHLRGRSSGFRSKPKKFGDHVSFDFILSYTLGSKGMDGESEVAVFKDHFTGWTQGFAVRNRESVTLLETIKQFAGSVDRIRVLYSDGGPEVDAALATSQSIHEISTPGVKQDNGVAERSNQTIEGGARTILLAAGLPTYFWPFAVAHFSFAYNIACRFNGSDSSWNLRFKKGQFKGPIIPFGALVDFIQIPSLTQAQSKFSPRAIPGVFMSYFLRPGGIWRGEYCVADLKEFSSVDLRRDSAPNKVKVQRVRDVTVPKGKPFEFPLKSKYDSVNRSLSIQDDAALDPEEYVAQPVEEDGGEVSDPPMVDGTPSVDALQDTAEVQSTPSVVDFDEFTPVLLNPKDDRKYQIRVSRTSGKPPPPPNYRLQKVQGHIPDHVTKWGDQWIGGKLFRPRKNTTRPPDVDIPT